MGGGAFRSPCRLTAAFLCAFSAIILLRLSPLKRIDCLTFNWNFALKLNGLTPSNYAISPKEPRPHHTQYSGPVKLRHQQRNPKLSPSSFQLANGKWFRDSRSASGSGQDVEQGYSPALRSRAMPTKRNGTERASNGSQLARIAHTPRLSWQPDTHTYTCTIAHSLSFSHTYAHACKRQAHTQKKLNSHLIFIDLGSYLIIIILRINLLSCFNLHIEKN